MDGGLIFKAKENGSATEQSHVARGALLNVN
jgi:hypothetical protein